MATKFYKLRTKLETIPYAPVCPLLALQGCLIPLLALQASPATPAFQSQGTSSTPSFSYRPPGTSYPAPDCPGPSSTPRTPAYAPGLQERHLPLQALQVLLLKAIVESVPSYRYKFTTNTA